MLAVVKVPHTEIRLTGIGARSVLESLKAIYKVVTVEKEDDEDRVDSDRSDWYRKMKGAATPGMALRVYRRNANLTQDDLEKKTGILKANLSSMENDKRPIGKSSAKKLAEAFGCDYHRFL